MLPRYLDVDVVWGGKLPGWGDYLWSSPRTPMRRYFEQWLDHGMQSGVRAFGEAWNERLRCAPNWSFLLPAQVLGSQRGIAGCIMPSTDRVGRRYPFVVGFAFSEQLPVRLPTIAQGVPSLLHETMARMGEVMSRRLAHSAVEGVLGNVLQRWEQGAFVEKCARVVHGNVQSDLLDMLGIEAHEVAPDPAESGEKGLVLREYPNPDMVAEFWRGKGPSHWWTSPTQDAPLRTLCLERAPDAGAFFKLMSAGASR